MHAYDIYSGIVYIICIQLSRECGGLVDNINKCIYIYICIYICVCVHTYMYIYIYNIYIYTNKQYIFSNGLLYV